VRETVVCTSPWPETMITGDPTFCSFRFSRT